MIPPQEGDLIQSLLNQFGLVSIVFRYLCFVFGVVFYCVCLNAVGIIAFDCLEKPTCIWNDLLCCMLHKTLFDFLLTYLFTYYLWCMVHVGAWCHWINQPQVFPKRHDIRVLRSERNVPFTDWQVMCNILIINYFVVIILFIVEVVANHMRFLLPDHARWSACFRHRCATLLISSKLCVRRATCCGPAKLHNIVCNKLIIWHRP